MFHAADSRIGIIHAKWTPSHLFCQESEKLAVYPAFHMTNLYADTFASRASEFVDISADSTTDFNILETNIALVQKRIATINIHMSEHYPIEVPKAPPNTALLSKSSAI